LSDTTRTAHPPDVEADTRELAAQLERLFDAQAKLCHQINNPLTSILGRAQILRLKHGSDPSLAAVAQVIEESAKRIADYVRQMATVVAEGRAATAGTGPTSAASARGPRA
jgi:nitrogen-specific signal transduction histidine kinase